jgi:acyl-[acyl-carrier-protein]-phospholipid O-acyltransferase/long-chain-fatty-acid--[acyl-carrier-protein] ligase
LFDREFGGLNIVEGYGVTEASPVVALNDPDNNISGTVGRLLPQMETRLDPIEGITEGGRLYIRGPNVMAGYIDPQTPDLIEAPQGGWHDTGDIVTIDDKGYVRILGRAKRFAKIAGEMISLTAVEILAESLWPDNRHAVVSVNDPKKGERLVIFTDHNGADLEGLGAWAKKTGTPNIAVPKKIIKLEQVPVLGSGKTDYQSLQKLAEIEMSDSRMIA